MLKLDGLSDHPAPAEQWPGFSFDRSLAHSFDLEVNGKLGPPFLEEVDPKIETDFVGLGFGSVPILASEDALDNVDGILIDLTVRVLFRTHRKTHDAESLSIQTHPMVPRMSFRCRELPIDVRRLRLASEATARIFIACSIGTRRTSG
jgi:hypothetical protein